jgi:flavin reductase (DIM6/NTAB) family NADH-FMN oxidoreductase RutF
MVKSERFKKQSWKPGNVLWPVPVVLVSCGGMQDWKPNLITIAWAGSVCSDPPMLSISVRPERHSHAIIQATHEFVVNIPSPRQAKVLDWCGTVSGRDVDKFAETGLTPAKALKVRCPIITECLLNIECRVQTFLKLGSHTMFVAEVVAVQVSSTLLDTKGRLRVEKGGLLAFAHGQYFELGRRLGHFGFSVRKQPRQTRR